MGLWHWAPDGMDPFDLALHVTEYQAILDADFYFLPSAVSGTPVIQILGLLHGSSSFPISFSLFSLSDFFFNFIVEPFCWFFISEFVLFFVLRCPLF